MEANYQEFLQCLNRIASIYNLDLITPELFLYCSLELDIVKKAFKFLKIDPSSMQIKLSAYVVKYSDELTISTPPIYSSVMEEIISKNEKNFSTKQNHMIPLENLLLDIYDHTETFASYFLRETGLQRDDFQFALSKARFMQTKIKIIYTEKKN